MKLLTFEDGIISLGGEGLPGIVTAVKIDGKLRYDEQKVDGKSGKKKTPKGWEDQVVTATIILPTDENSDCYEKLEKLAAWFKKPDSKANPQIFTFFNRHAQSRGVRQVLFDRLESVENDQIDSISVNLGFTEHNPPIVKLETAQAKGPTPKELAKKAEEKIAQKASGSAQPQADNTIIDAR